VRKIRFFDHALDSAHARAIQGKRKQGRETGTGKHPKA
jgi:hypothetical protein